MKADICGKYENQEMQWLQIHLFEILELLLLTCNFGFLDAYNVCIQRFHHFFPFSVKWSNAIYVPSNNFHFSLNLLQKNLKKYSFVIVVIESFNLKRNLHIIISKKTPNSSRNFVLMHSVATYDRSLLKREQKPY